MQNIKCNHEMIKYILIKFLIIECYFIYIFLSRLDYFCNIKDISQTQMLFINGGLTSSSSNITCNLMNDIVQIVVTKL